MSELTEQQQAALVIASQRDRNPDEFFNSIAANGGSGSALAANFQSRADAVFRMYGATAPDIQPHEKLEGYRQRLLNGLKHYSDAAHASMDFRVFPTATLPEWEKTIIGKAIELFQRPEGPERSCVRRDHTGRAITHFFGGPDEIWGRFQNEDKRGHINRSMGRGEHSVHARDMRVRGTARTAGIAGAHNE